MTIMKKTLSATILALACAVCASAQGSVSYALPQTTLQFTVEASCETFHAGPYARYASKYLGIPARTAGGTTCSISSIKVRTLVEADQQARYSLALNDNSEKVFLQLTSQGLVAGPQNAFGSDSGWKYTPSRDADFSFKGLPANLTSESSTLYTQGRGSVQQSVVVEKTDEQKAAEVAGRIFEIRENKYKILIGDTDATYSGEAMKATIDALDKMEEDYLTLFTGYSEKNVQTATFEVVPDASRKSQLYVAFRVSDKNGLVGAEDIDGRPVYMELAPEEVETPPAVKGTRPEQSIRYRIPAVCVLTMSDTDGTLLRMRVPVYQLGIESTYPIFKK